MLQATATTSAFPCVPRAPREIRTLLLDDSNFDRARIRRLSHKTDLCVHMDEVDSIAAMDKAVAQNNYDLILIDYRLPVGDGMQALQHLMQSDLNKDAGRIMITGDSAQQTAVKAMRSGYHDFLTKEAMDVEALREAMINAVTVARQQQELMLQASEQRKLIREALAAALLDSDVQGKLVLLIGQSQSGGNAGLDHLHNRFDAANVDELLAGMDDEDDFIFH